MSPENSPVIVQPDEQNEDEMDLAIAIDNALEGRSLFTSVYERQLALEQNLTSGGSLSRMRREFRENVLQVMVPELEKATFEGPAQGDPKMKQDLANMQKNNATRLAAAIRKATAALVE